MVSEILKKAGEYVQELNEKLATYRQFTKDNIPKIFDKQEGRKPPKDFNESSFLYIRSYDGDVGIRPFSNIVFWNSPDISIAPLTNTTAYTNTVEAGLAYEFSSNVRNRGDLIVPSANVEFFLVNPSLGFDTRFATRLGRTRCWLNSQSVARPTIQYTIPPSESGHKCLVVRAYAYSPLDIPVDDYQLSPPIDRHVAQLNLNIVGQTSAYSFNLVHLPKALEHIAFIPITPNQILKLRHPFLADYRIVEKVTTGQLRKIEINPVGKNDNIEIVKEESGFKLTIKGKDGMEVEKQAEIMRAITNALRAINEGKAKPTQFKELFRTFREMNKPMQNTLFKMNVPDFGLQKGEASGFQIMNTSLNDETKGGITLIVTN